MKKSTSKHACKYALYNYECGMCETGVVQVFSKVSRGELTTTISGCLDCGHSYGLRQAQDLTKYTRDDMTWA